MDRDELIARLRVTALAIHHSETDGADLDNVRDAIAALESRPAPTEERFTCEHDPLCPLNRFATDTTPSRDEEGSVDREAIARQKEQAFYDAGYSRDDFWRVWSSAWDAALKTSTPETQTVEGGGQ